MVVISDKQSPNNAKNGSPGCVLNTKHYFSEFCGNTSIHGFKFLGENRTIIERLWWFVVVGASLYCCVMLILQTYQKWVSSPVIVSFATSQTSIRDIPFPAITICSDVKMKSEKFNYTDVEDRLDNEENVTAEEEKNYDYMNMVCESSAWSHHESRMVDKEALDFITDIVPPLNATITRIGWRGKKHEETDQFFTPVLTTEGVCYSFNILDRKDIFTDTTKHYKNFFFNGNSSSWTIQDGFTKDEPKRYPRFSVVSGTDGGIDFVLHVSDEDINYRCSPDFVGFKVTLQHPALIPRGRKSFFSVPLDQIVLATVKPVILKTSNELRNYLPDKRKCYFAAEKSLKFYKTYNQPNCLLECLRNFTVEHCGCVPFHMPSDNTTQICGAGSRKCTEKAKAEYLINQSAKNEPGNQQQSYQEKCHCLPSCTSLDFEVETSQSNWHWQKVYANDPNVFAKSHYSRLKVYFKDMQFITSIRNELYGTTDFLASCGGLLGLFMGFSAISLFEIIYFVTLRLFCNLRRHGWAYWSGSEQLISVKD